MKFSYLFLFLSLSLLGFAQSPTPQSIADKADSDIAGQSHIEVPSRTLLFKARDSAPHFAASAVTSLPQCDQKGTLFLDMLDPANLDKHDLVSVDQIQTHSYPIAGISDLHDISVYSFFPSDAMVALLVRATKEMPKDPGPGKSPAGVAWRDYHNYIAEFDRNGTYKKSVELPMSYQVSQLAVFPTGDFLITGFDTLNSAPRLLYLDSSGRVVRSLDFPAARRTADNSSSYGSVEEARSTTALLGSIAFTPYKADILVWTRDGSDPILDVGPGGTSREIPLETPPGFVFVEMISAGNRWVGHFRSRHVVQNSPFNPVDYSYYELQPQDGSLASKLLLGGASPQTIACGGDGTYIAYKRDNDNKLVLLTADQ